MPGIAIPQLVQVRADQATTWRVRLTVTSKNLPSTGTPAPTLYAAFRVIFGVGQANDELVRVLAAQADTRIPSGGGIPSFAGLPAQATDDLVIPAEWIEVIGLVYLDATDQITTDFSVSAFAAPIFQVPYEHGP